MSAPADPTTTGRRITVVATLTVRRAAAADFHAFERLAAAVVLRHGGRLERVVVGPAPDPALFREVHVLTFPDPAAFAAYRADPALAAAAGLRAAAVVDTDLLVGEDGPDYTGGAGGRSSSG